jgi:hypothetical protein
VTRRLVFVALLIGACGGNVPVPVASLSPTPRSTAAVASVSSTPSTTPLTSARGFITVARPLANSRLRPPITISGDASVFEAALTWRITDSAGRVLASGSTTASAGAPARGTYAITASFTPPASDTIAIVEVYELSPRDGTIDEIVRVPVVITP